MDDCGANPISIRSHRDGTSILVRVDMSLDGRVVVKLGGEDRVTALLRATVDNDPSARVDLHPPYHEGRSVWTVALPVALAGKIAKKANTGLTGALRRAIEGAAA